MGNKDKTKKICDRQLYHNAQVLGIWEVDEDGEKISDKPIISLGEKKLLKIFENEKLFKKELRLS